jgi:hypothetical protein
MENVPLGAKIWLKKYDTPGMLINKNDQENCYMMVVGEKYERWIMKYMPEEKTLELVMNLNEKPKMAPVKIPIPE